MRKPGLKRAFMFLLPAPLVLLAIPSLIGAPAESNAQPVHSVVAAAVQPCAKNAGVLLEPSVFDPEMVTTQGFSNQGPTLHAHAGSTTQTVVHSGFLWMQDANDQLGELPIGFNRLSPSPLVTQYPSRILAVIQTVQTFDSTSDASQFVAGFTGGGSTIPQVIISGALVPVPANPAANPGLGDESIVVEIRPPTSGFAAVVQFVMRRGTTVVTLELIGGSDLRTRAVVGLASQALARVEAICSI